MAANIGTGWTAQEEEKLREIWVLRENVKTHLSDFPGRSLKSIFLKAKRMGLGHRPHSPIRPRNPITLNFMRHVEKTDGCWIWRGGFNKDGYGSFSLNGKMIGAHRASFIIEHGSIPHEMHILHSCDNPSCVNPKHLYAGTRSRNMKDMVERNRRRHLKGEECPSAKLTNGQASEIRYLYSTGDFNYRDLSNRFSVSASTIGNVIRGATYREA